MKRKTLEYLLSKGSILTFPCFSGSDLSISQIQKILKNLDSVLLLDFKGYFSSFQLESAETLFLNDYKELKTPTLCQDFWAYSSPPYCYFNKEASFSLFMSNLINLQQKYSYILCLLPVERTPFFFYFLEASHLIVLSPENEEEASEISIAIEGFKKYSNLIWWSPYFDSIKSQAKLYRQAKFSQKLLKSKPNLLEVEASIVANELKNFLRIQILEKNPISGLPRIFLSLIPLLFFLFAFSPFVFSQKLGLEVSNLRDARMERDMLSGSPYFEYEFDGKENLQRIARYAVGRFNAKVTSPSILKDYVREVLEKNGFTENSWFKNQLHTPPLGTKLRFLPSESIQSTPADTIGLAWRYFTSLISDSVSYLTELYHENPKTVGRIHLGIDVASRQGARILAPFAAKAWTFKDNRGGVVIGLVQKEKVILFMHCDQLLYLNGQEVMAGDPIATVGTTGHTTGPHVHIETGLVDKKGTKALGNVRYNTVSPITWYYSQVKSSVE